MADVMGHRAAKKKRAARGGPAAPLKGSTSRKKLDSIQKDKRASAKNLSKEQSLASLGKGSATQRSQAELDPGQAERKS